MFERTAKFVREFATLSIMSGTFGALALITRRWELNVVGLACFVAMWMVIHDYTSQIAAVKNAIDKLPPNLRIAADAGVLLAIIGINAFIYMTGMEVIRQIVIDRVIS